MGPDTAAASGGLFDALSNMCKRDPEGVCAADPASKYRVPGTGVERALLEVPVCDLGLVVQQAHCPVRSR